MCSSPGYRASSAVHALAPHVELLQDALDVGLQAQHHGHLLIDACQQLGSVHISGTQLRV